MTLELVLDREVPPIRARVLACDCDLDGCNTMFVVATLQGAREQLWIGLGVARPTEIETVVGSLLENCDVGEGRNAANLVEHGMALLGLTWPQVLHREVLEAQVGGWVRLPDWMDRLPLGQLWLLRGLVFGSDLTRVPRALWALEHSYSPEAPAGEAFTHE